MSQATRMLHQSNQGQTVGEGATGDHGREESLIVPLRINGNSYIPIQRIFMQRDYRLGVAIRFMTDLPVELAGRIDPHAFDYTFSEINKMFEEAEQLNCGTFCESCIGFITANLYWLCRDSRYERALKKVSRFISEQNQRVYLPNSLYITDPVLRGLRCIQIDVLADSASQRVS